MRYEYVEINKRDNSLNIDDISQGDLFRVIGETRLWLRTDQAKRATDLEDGGTGLFNTEDLELVEDYTFTVRG